MLTQNQKQKLIEKFEEIREREFSWKHNNCAFCVSEIVETYSGIDYASSWRGMDITKEDIKRILRYHGSYGLLLSRIGFREIPRDALGTGDVVTCQVSVPGESKSREAIGIWVEGSGYVKGDRTWVELKKEQCERAWRVKELCHKL